MIPHSYRVQCTLGSIPIDVLGTIVAYHDDLESTLLLDWRAELVGVELEPWGCGTPVVVSGGNCLLSSVSMAIWDAAIAALEANGPSIRERAGVQVAPAEDPNVFGRSL